MKNDIPYTSYQGSAAELCRKGDAVEFIQPWYSPISTTPENTGMAVGGIGNTFTLTAKGDTPNFSFIPGIFIDCSNEDIHFNDFYLSVMDRTDVENLDIDDFDQAIRYLNFYPALFNGKRSQASNKEELLADIRAALTSGAFYYENQSNFERWNIEYSPKTKRRLSFGLQGKQHSLSIEIQILVAMDFFDGLLTNNTAQAFSLSADNRTPPKGVRRMASDAIDYQALYPMARFQYGDFNGIKVVRKVVSPIVKGDKRLCSLPMHWNHFELTNQSDTSQKVTLVQPLRNLIGSTYHKLRDGIQDSACKLTQNPIAQKHSVVTMAHRDDKLCNKLFSGVSLRSESPYGSDIEGEVIYGVQADKTLVDSGKINVTVKSSVYSSKSATQVSYALKTGRTSDLFTKGIYTEREALDALVVVEVELDSGDCVDLRFAQVMDHSKISLNGWTSEKAYGQFFDPHERASSILAEILPQLESIESRIALQQTEFRHTAEQQFENRDNVERFSTMAMNTLSFLAESTVWDKEDTFLVKECVDYPFFNSLDVYFYGSFSLLYLLPELDGCVMKSFADAILAADDTKRRYWEYEDLPYAELVDKKYEGTRAVSGAVIHDLGSPFDIQPDAYTWHNVKEWKDLAPKYALMVYRHYQHCDDLDVVKACWSAVKASIEFLCRLIEEGDTLPLTRGTDDTFDNLASHGVSIYCASLWAAGLKAAAALATLMDETALANEYAKRSSESLNTLESGLWDEKKGYYHFYITPVQAKHLTGEGFEPLKAMGLNLSGDAVHDKHVINDYLDQVDTQSDLSKLAQRTQKKQALLEAAPEAFTPAYKELVPDSDNSFGDALLADSYLKLMGMEGLFSETRIQRTLDYIYQHNFVMNSPKLGVANMVLADGSPHDAFQAQDVWVGVQFSMATALRLSGKKAQAETLMDTVYQSLYHYAKIPFAAPEGFNCSVTVSEQDLANEFNLTPKGSQEWLTVLKSTACLLPDGRVNPELTKDVARFAQLVSPVIEPTAALHQWLLNTGLKYTAGRYFRPGMIFAYLYTCDE